jgi:hypothetical protein
MCNYACCMHATPPLDVVTNSEGGLSVQNLFLIQLMKFASCNLKDRILAADTHNRMDVSI